MIYQNEKTDVSQFRPAGIEDNRTIRSRVRPVRTWVQRKPFPRATPYILVFFSLMILSVGCGTPESPEELRGSWVTSNPRYALCSIEIDQGSIVFQNGSDHFDYYEIEKIEKTAAGDDGKVLFSIHYKDGEGESFSLSFYYFSHAESGPSIQFKNQEDLIWIRERPSRDDSE